MENEENDVKDMLQKIVEDIDISSDEEAGAKKGLTEKSNEKSSNDLGVSGSVNIALQGDKKEMNKIDEPSINIKTKEIELERKSSEKAVTLEIAEISQSEATPTVEPVKEDMKPENLDDESPSKIIIDHTDIKEETETKDGNNVHFENKDAEIKSDEDKSPNENLSKEKAVDTIHDENTTNVEVSKKKVNKSDTIETKEKQAEANDENKEDDQAFKEPVTKKVDDNTSENYCDFSRKDNNPSNKTELAETSKKNLDLNEESLQPKLILDPLNRDQIDKKIENNPTKEKKSKTSSMDEESKSDLIQTEIDSLEIKDVEMQNTCVNLDEKVVGEETDPLETFVEKKKTSVKPSEKAKGTDPLETKVNLDEESIENIQFLLYSTSAKSVELNNENNEIPQVILDQLDLKKYSNLVIDSNEKETSNSTTTSSTTESNVTKTKTPARSLRSTSASSDNSDKTVKSAKPVNKDVTLIKEIQKRIERRKAKQKREEKEEEEDADDSSDEVEIKRSRGRPRKGVKFPFPSPQKQDIKSKLSGKRVVKSNDSKVRSNDLKNKQKDKPSSTKTSQSKTPSKIKEVTNRKSNVEQDSKDESDSDESEVETLIASRPTRKIKLTDKYKRFVAQEKHILLPDSDEEDSDSPIEKQSGKTPVKKSNVKTPIEPKKGGAKTPILAKKNVVKTPVTLKKNVLKTPMRKVEGKSSAGLKETPIVQKKKGGTKSSLPDVTKKSANVHSDENNVPQIKIHLKRTSELISSDREDDSKPNTRTTRSKVKNALSNQNIKESKSQTKKPTEKDTNPTKPKRPKKELISEEELSEDDDDDFEPCDDEDKDPDFDFSLNSDSDTSDVILMSDSFNESVDKGGRTVFELMKDVFHVMPSWNIHILPNSSTVCMAQMSRSVTGVPMLKKCIEMDASFNVKVYVHQIHYKKYDGVYDSEDHFVQLLQLVDSM